MGDEEFKQLMYFTLIIVAALALGFSIYTNYNFSKNQQLFQEDYKKFQDDFVKGAFDLKMILEEPQVYENFYDSCNEKNLYELIENLNMTVNHLEETIEDFKKYSGKIKNLETVTNELVGIVIKEEVVEEEILQEGELRI